MPVADLIYNRGERRPAVFLQQKHLFKIQKHKQILYNLFSAVLIGCDWHIKTCQWYQNAFYSIYSKPKVRGEGQERLWAAYQTNQKTSMDIPSKFTRRLSLVLSHGQYTKRSWIQSLDKRHF